MSDTRVKWRQRLLRRVVPAARIAMSSAFLLTSFALWTASASAADARDFEGNWRHMMDMVPPSNSLPALPYTPEARRIVERRMQLSRDNKPAVGTHLGCRPPTGFEALTPSVNALVLQTPTKLTILNQEERGVWQIYIDQPHSKNKQRSYMGESVARWEGDTLVVDTIGYNGKGWVDLGGSPLSDKVHVVTRISKSADGNTLTLTATFTDPVYYAEPFSKTFEWRRIDARLVDYDCAENPREEDFSSWTFEDDWFKPVCVRRVTNGLASDKVTCEPRSKRNR